MQLRLQAAAEQRRQSGASKRSAGLAGTSAPCQKEAAARCNEQGPPGSRAALLSAHEA